MAEQDILRTAEKEKEANPREDGANLDGFALLLLIMMVMVVVVVVVVVVVMVNIYKETTRCNLAVCLLVTAILLYMFRTLSEDARRKRPKHVE
jgi:flagellar basal body-associated protein FliL